MSKKPYEPFRVTDHALLRYLERVRGFGFDKERAEIAKICAGMDTGAVLAHGCRFEVKNGVLVTITPLTATPNRTKRQEVGEKFR